VAASVWLYAVPTVPAGSEAVVIVGATTAWQFGSFASYRLSPSLSTPRKSPTVQFSLIFACATGLHALFALVPVVP